MLLDHSTTRRPSPITRYRRRTVRRRLAIEQVSPLRPLDYRWRLAGEFIEQGAAAPAKSEDALLHDAVRFRRQLDRTETSEQYHRLCSESAVGQAHAVFTGPDEAKDLLETRLLTGEPLADTATHINSSLATVTAYEALFYCVRDRLRARDYIVRRAIGLTLSGAPSVQCIVKAFAYFGGASVLHAIIASEFGGQMGLGFGEQMLTESGRQQMRVQLAIKAMTEPFSGALAREIGRVAALVRQLEAESRASDAANAIYATLVDSLTVALGTDSTRVIPADSLSPAQTTTAADEAGKSATVPSDVKAA